MQAGSGVEALELIDQPAGKIDLVVSDVVMPEMDGPTLLRELRKQHSDLSVIFVSGYAEEAFRKNLPAGEKFTFLPKPFTLKQLVEVVKETTGIDIEGATVAAPDGAVQPPVRGLRDELTPRIRVERRDPARPVAHLDQ